MIEHGLSLEKLGEVTRIDISRAAKVSLRGIEDLAGDGVVEVRRAWGAAPSGPSEAYSTAKTLDLSGNQTTDIDPEDCTHLAIVVTTVGVGGFDLEWNTQGRRYTRLERLQIPLDDQGLAWRGPLQPADRVATMVVSLSDDAGSPAISLRRFIDPDSQGYGSSSIAIDGSSTTFQLGAIAEIGIFCDQAADDILADVWICYSTNIESTGLERMGIAYLDAAQEFTSSNLFSGNFQIGDLATGVHTISSSATSNQSLDIPDEGGEICILTDLSPAFGEMLYRDGDGFELTDVIKYGMLSIFETMTIDADFVEISAGSAWAVTAPDAVFLNSLSSLGALITWLESSSKGSNGIGIQAPATVGSSGAVDYTLPLKPSSADQILVTDASGVLTWIPISGSTPPASPFDGQPFWKDGELYHWDDTRGKWLGELREVHLSRQFATTGSSLQLRAGGDAILDTLTGWLWDEDVTIVEARGWSKLAMTGDLDLMQQSTKLNTILSWSSSKYASSTTLNISVNGATSVERKCKMQNITSGTCDDPYCIVGYRKELT